MTKRTSRVSLIHRFLPGTRKRNKYGLAWRSDNSGYGKKSSSQKKWHKVISTVVPSRLIAEKKTRSYLSRAELRKKYLQKILKISAVTIVIVLSVMLLKKPVVHYLSVMDFFKIQDVSVSGCRVTQPGDIKEVAGAKYNTSILLFSPKEAKRRVEQYPWVKDAQIERLWPDGVSITISEYAASAIMFTGEYDEQKMVYVDRKGNVIAPVKPGDDTDYPVVTGGLQLAENVREKAITDAFEFLTLISKNDANLPAQSVSEIHLDEVEGMVVHLVDYPFPIYFGRGDVKKKYQQLRNVLAVLYKKRKKNIDIGNIEYIRMDYTTNKVLVAQENSG